MHPAGRKLSRPQLTVEVAGVKVGGEPGSRPVALAGTIFYEGHKVVFDHDRGSFDRGAAERLLCRQAELSEATGAPAMVDVFGRTGEALRKYLDFVAGAVECPVILDSHSPRALAEAVRYAAEVGLSKRIIYNSVSASTKPSDLETVAGAGLGAVICLAYNPSDLRPEGRLSILEGPEGLLELAGRIKSGGVLIDVGILDVPSLGMSLDAIWLVKDRLGLPSGCGPTGALATWRRLRAEWGRRGYEACSSAIIAMAVQAGADFILYGPIEDAEFAFISCAMADAICAYASSRLFGVRAARGHPLYRIF